MQVAEWWCGCEGSGAALPVATQGELGLVTSLSGGRRIALQLAESHCGPMMALRRCPQAHRPDWPLYLVLTGGPPHARKFAPRKSVSTGMSNTGSTEPFKMRIPSPDPGLTGQALAKEVPDDPNRTGSVYADQYLAHKCPQHFDEIQRRQFFCILDLRRLKYAADEIFAKKDWKLNILNFAKEYEKSRGLIMLRYGLYEFKNVKPSSEVLKKWRAAHGLPSEPEEDQNSGRQNHRMAAPAGPTKRKAEDELTPKDNALMASTVNQNKRRNLTQEASDPILTGPAPFKNKRKADETEEASENKPNKQQKSAPSTATSLFESIINKPRNGAASPAKPTSQASPLFGVTNSKDSQNSSFATKANPFQQASSSLLFGPAKTDNTATSSESVLSNHKIGSTPVMNTGNIFSYLSESSPGSSGDEDGDDDDHETDDDADQDSEEQDASAAVSTNTSTPPVQNGSSLFGTGKTSDTSNIFGGLSKPVDQAAKGGLFGRVQMGANGQPVRASPVPDEKQDGSVKQPLTTNETPAKTPGDYTFNPATTPISFGQSTLSVSKSFGTPDVAPEPKKPISIFGASSQVSSEPKLNPSSLFGSSTSTKPAPSEAPVSIFAPQKPAPSPASTSIFGAPPTVSVTNSIFGSDKQTSESSSTTKKQAVSIFDKPTASASTASETKSIFGNVDEKTSSKTSSATPTIEGKVTSIFDKSFIAKGAAEAKTFLDNSKPSLDLFSRNSNPLFGATKDAKAESKVPAVKEQTPSIFDKSFIAESAAQAKALLDTPKPSLDLFSRGSNPLFSASKINGNTPTNAKPIFGQVEKPVSANPTSDNGMSQTSNGSNKENTGSVLGLKAPAVASPAVSIFGTQTGPKSAAPTSTLFGEKKPEEPAKPASSIFGSTPSGASSIFSFGSQPTSNTTIQPPSTTFGGGLPSSGLSFGSLSSTSQSQANGSQPKKLDFQFGGSDSSNLTSTFTFGQESVAPTGGSFTFTAGSDKQTVNNPFAPSVPAFGGNSSTSTPSSSFTFGFGQPASSTPKAAPSTQGASLFGQSTNTNGAPSLSFTQASPSQNSSDAKFSKSVAANPFAHLQPNEGSTIANSPFPAPSSIGTTPVNGTPEPQSPREDGGEAPQEQIKLTDGGPGEEDETILHEVRAKAIKYIPVQKGDEDQPKSPWSTRGVGPLRVLKNKSTGSVRILLRAEPRGHIAMNKTILSDVKYVVKEKTVNFVAASDDGSGLETWVLQVKKPEFAVELAGVLEANKFANKK
ncbi:hypothetical protein NUW58_g3423 [Xylaria curta]|uniref:Uncharacterized protein n=1 Tax=Xylaria curta TaxID=42375 RepID=A0ACC1PB20_9PEZI|nr:hypothetical protein NUW58_g3423 [Xylaria curta]